jgi:peptide/nickel transport system substrate-binding protein
MSNSANHPGGPSRRTVLFLGAAAAGMSVLPAWAQTAPGTLRIIHPALADWSPLRGGLDHYRWNALWWASPMRYDKNGDIQPYVLASWSASGDNKVWTFKVDPKATFSDGSKITAADVKGSFEVAAMPATTNQRINQVLPGVEGFDDVANGTGSTIAGLVAVDDETLEIHLSNPDPIYFMRLANHLAPILSPKQVRDASGNENPGWWYPQNNPIVSGPFRPTAMNLDTGELAFEPNVNFFGPKPKLAKITVTTIEDSVVATQLLQKGDYDAHSIIRTPTLAEDLGPEFVDGPTVPQAQMFWFSFSRPPTDDPKVRQALIMAIDRKGLIQATYPNGPDVPAEQILHKLPGVDEHFEPYPYDPEGARKALAESSYGGPDKLPRIMFSGISRPLYEVAAQYIAEQWRQNLGIDTVGMKPDLDSYSGPDQANVQIQLDDTSTRVPDATVFLSGAIASTSSNAANALGGYKNDKVDALLAEASMLPLDDPRRDDLARQAQRLFFDDYPAVPWVHQVMSRWARKNVTNVVKNLDWQVTEPWDIDVV